MIRDFIITHELGLHARPATALVQTANQFRSNMYITHNGITTDLKSIMGVLSLGVARGAAITIRIEGDDQEEAMKAISHFFQELKLL